MPKKALPKIKQAPLVEDKFQTLAHAGTKEAINKLETLIKNEKDYEKRIGAEMALEECELLYYEPTNSQEEEEFMLCVLISRRQNRIDDAHFKVNNLKEAIHKFNLEKKVHAKVMASHQDKKEEWKYNCSDDFIFFEKNKLAELQKEIVYDEAWIAEAKKMIKTAKYKTGIPERYLSHYSFDFDDDCCSEDDCDCDDDDCFRHNEHSSRYGSTDVAPF